MNVRSLLSSTAKVAELVCHNIWPSCVSLHAQLLSLKGASLHSFTQHL